MWEAWAIRDPSPEPECNAKKDCPQAFHAPRAAANAKQPDAQKTKKTGTLSEFIFGSGRNGPGAALKMQHPHEPSTTRPRCDSTRILTTSRFSCLKHALGQPGSFFDEVAFGALQPAQPDDFRRRVHLPARLPVGEQMGQDEGVPPVVLSSGRGEPVAEAVELLGVEREHRDAALQQGPTSGPCTASSSAFVKVGDGRTISQTKCGRYWGRPRRMF